MKELHEFLVRCLASHREWIIVTNDGRSFAFENSEIEVDEHRDRMLFGFPSDTGYQTWRIDGAETRRDELHLSLSRAAGSELSSVRLVPRASFSELQASVELARLERANRVAAMLRESFRGLRLNRVELNRENGRFAQIRYEQSGIARACIADVSDSLLPEFLISSACFWLAKLSKRKRDPVRSVAIAAEKRSARRLQKLHALLREDWRSRVSVLEIKDDGRIDARPALEFEDLWSGSVPDVRVPILAQPTDTARNLIALAPEAIDSVFSRQGETVRYHGLPFARIRRLAGTERCWFGTDRNRQLLSEANVAELASIVDELREYRRFASENRRHAFYHTAPEAWLESILRRDIRRLDANLVLSPVYHQFRAEREKIDLLALRRDGRLVIIELKVEPDREAIFQTIDYWRKIERIRRAGKLRSAGLFGNLEIADAPTICYLAAPTLAFHRDFDFTASLVSPAVEIHRFNLAEDWRRRLRVLERRRAR